MRRREFITLLGGAAAAWPLAARAQQAGKLPTIGFLGADAAAWRPWTDAFVERLRELGWIEGRTIAIEYRWSEGRPERAAEIAAEFVRLKVDVIVTVGTGVAASKQATAVIPIVFAVGDRPGRRRPGRKSGATGRQRHWTVDPSSPILPASGSNSCVRLFPGSAGWQSWLMLAIPEAVLEMGEVQAAARTLGLEVAPLEIRRAEDIAPAFEALKAQADALYVVADALVAANRTRIITFALGARLPTIFNTRDYVQAGGLMSYGPNFPDLFRRAAELVDKILRGTKPGDIPVEQPTKFELVINLKTAKALGLERAADAARPRRRGDRVKTPRVRSNNRCRGGPMAAWVTRATGQPATVYRCSVCDGPKRSGSADTGKGVRGRVTGSRVDRGQERSAGVPLGAARW